MKSKIKSDEQLTKKYAFSIRESKAGKKMSGGNSIDFSKLNRGFYDEIEKNDVSIKYKLSSLKHIKGLSLKEFVYTNKEIPEQWKNKLDYKDGLLKMFVKDKTFLTYLGQGGDSQGMHMETDINLPSKKELRKKTLPKIELEKTITKNTTPQENEISKIKEETEDKNLQARKELRLKYMPGQKKELTEKEIINILDDFKLEYPIKEKLQTMYTKNSPQPNTTENSNYSKYVNNTISSSSKGIQMMQTMKKDKRQLAFRQSIFTNLVPSTRRNWLIDTPLSLNKKKTITSIVSNKKNNKNREKYGPFLNFDYEDFNKKVEITNPLVKKYLESINFFGPYFSYCPPCRNKNLEYYKNLESNQCIELIQFIKRARGKSAIIGEGNDDSKTLKTSKEKQKSKNKDNQSQLKNDSSEQNNENYEIGENANKSTSLNVHKSTNSSLEKL